MGKSKGDALQHASKELRADREVALEAVKSDGHALQYISEELQGDREIVLEAVKSNGYSVRYASKELKADKEVMLVAQVLTVKKVGAAINMARALGGQGGGVGG